MVSHCGGDVVGGERRRRGRCDPTREQFRALPETHVARRTATHRSRPRMLSCYARGIVTIIGRLIRGDGLVVGRFVPEPWPTRPSVPKKKSTRTIAHVALEAA
jgi:hypothetical protein